MNSGSEFLDLILEKQLDSHSEISFILISVDNETLAAGLIDLSNFDLAHMHNACGVNVIAQENFSLAFMEGGRLTRLLVYVNYMGTVRAPDYIFIIQWEGVAAFHDLELDLRSDMDIYR